MIDNELSVPKVNNFLKVLLPHRVIHLSKLLKVVFHNPLLIFFIEYLHRPSLIVRDFHDVFIQFTLLDTRLSCQSSISQLIIFS
jgi:hypothetical protein